MKLKEMRIESGLKAYKVAEKLGISRAQLCNLEKGKYKISDDKVKIFSELYGRTEKEIKEAVK